MERLISKNLMIGDWVYDPYSKKNEKVTGTTLKHIRLFNGDFSTRTYEPIPITEEILKKNGFVERMYSPYFGEYVSEDRRITFSHLSNSIGKDWYCHIDNEDMETIGGADVQYVHELQHLFNLCEIEREITL